jgi:quercetin dioxygenase-like cupin family protein
MKMLGIPFGIVTWDEVDATERPGEVGFARWRTQSFGSVRVRMVEYSAGYVADHWCDKGHILLCLDGRLKTELDDGRSFILTPGTSYQVGDGGDLHRSSTEAGARVFIVD